jgi:DNA-binding NarL/FixJ family response regulator
VRRALQIGVVGVDATSLFPVVKRSKVQARCWMWRSFGEEDIDIAIMSTSPDVLVVNSCSQGFHAVILVRRLNTMLSNLPILVILPSFAWDEILDGIMGGAVGFLLNPFAPEDLARAIEEVIQNGISLCPEVQLAMLTYFRRTVAENNIGGLSWQELKVMHLLARGLSRQEIATEIHISSATVHSHVSNIYAKLHVHSREQARRKFAGLDEGSGRTR